ncbi:MAG: polar amino acid transport system substrate-binding protein [bacterium]|jgi:polar amino acid transport system substrate-binding protein
MRILYFTVIFLLSFGVASAKDKSVFLIGANSVPPYKIIQGQQLKGINGDIIQEIVKKMNVKVQVVQCLFPNCLKKLQQGKIDAFLGLFKTADREKYFQYISPPYNKYSNKAFYIHQDSKIKIKHYKDLYQKKIRRIGVTKGYKHFSRFDNDTKLNRISVSHHIQNLYKLNQKKVDVVILTETLGDYLIKKHKLSNLKKVKFHYTKKNPSYLAISKKSKYMNKIQELELGVKVLVKKDLVSQFINKWTH